ncbi:DUF5682 family protein [Methylobacterium sp. Leaf466]|uniref:DUF5682 family protein n=1 Tax=Methylobacterium sp. Leaf466 TaxID=1736386 RepID=UPI0006F2793F|nr:DUF5682 family protein [Methylobacterium sp. Leaf466]KQT78164.1 hypothetical protein ASG59_09235 [Methylobacterium sp. Leaf466]
MSEIRIFGIRHHGPGSARSLVRALDAFAPDCLLVEGPPDAEALLALAADPEMRPPVALLVYRADRPRDCAFFPFAAFSPEWVALRHAQEREVPARFIDLPHAIQLADGFGELATEGPAAIDDEAEKDPERGPATAAMRRDPLGELARAAGYDDGERWWDAFVESRSEAGEDVFSAIAEAMAALREAEDAMSENAMSENASPDAERFREEAREAHMRTGLRRAAKDGFSRIAVVCGAWHAPALARHDATGQPVRDAAILKGLPKTKVAAAWAPWSYERLATASGYRAGVLSPEWYDAVWHHGDRVAARWLSRAAALLRGEDLDASSATVIEAVRLAGMLAGLRGRSRPSLDDLDEAAASTLCFADPAPMRLIRAKLVIGERLGATPAGSARTPVELDFAAQCKRLRLSPEGGSREIVLDLRKEGDLARSHFLNRLALVGIPWGTRRQAGGRGTFREAWVLAWQPEWAVDLVAASADGGTVADAAASRIRTLAHATTRVSDLSDLIGTLLDADLAQASADVVQALDDRAAVSSDVFDLMQALPALAELARYGSVRSSDTEPVRRIVRGIVPRIAAGLVVACQSLDDDAAALAKGHVEGVHRAVSLLEESDLGEVWRDALLSLAGQDHVHGRVVGRAVRLLFDARAISAEDAGTRLRPALSRASGAAPAAAWIAGFLEGGGTALIHGDGLLGILDDWLVGLDADHFTDLLPLVRRSFATIPRPERRAIGEALRRPGGTTPDATGHGHGFDAARAARVLPVLRLLLGPEPAPGGDAR